MKREVKNFKRYSKSFKLARVREYDSHMPIKKQRYKISMGLKATDNAYAERLNGIIKNEWN